MGASPINSALPPGFELEQPEIQQSSQLPEGFELETKPSIWDKFGEAAALQAKTLYQPEAIPQLGAGALEGLTLGGIDIAQPETGGGQAFREAGRLTGLRGPVAVIQRMFRPIGIWGRLAGAGTAGAAVEAAREYFKGEEISPKEIFKEAAIWSALDGSVVLGNMINYISKASGQKPTTVMRFLWDKAKSKFKNPFHTTPTEQDIMFGNVDINPNVEKVILKEAEKEAKNLSPEKTFKGLKPEHEIIEKAEPLLKEELEKQLPTKPFVSPEIKFDEIGEPIKPTLEKTDVHQAERNVGQIFSQAKIPNTNVASRGIREEINTLSNNAYKTNNAQWEKSKLLNQGVETIQPEMIESLKRLVEEINLSPKPSTIQNDIREIANRFIKLGSLEESFKPIPNARIIAQRQSNNQKINHDYMQGRPNNAYNRLNEILDAALESSAELFPEARKANLEARQGYAEWQRMYGNNEILPWRDPSVVAHSKLFKSIENPDQLAAINNVLDQSKKGNLLYRAVLRDFVEKQMRPYIENPKKVGDLSYEEKLRELTPITTPEERTKLDRLMNKIASPYKKYEKALIKYEKKKKSHDKLSKDQKEILKNEKNKAKNIIDDWKTKTRELKQNFPYKNPEQILRDLTSVQGLKRLEKWLPKTKEGKQLLEEMKEYAAVNLLSQGKIIPSDNVMSLRKILNDINSRALLEHTLGKEIVNDLHKIVNNVEKIDKKFDKIKKVFKIGKTGAKFIPGIRGNIASLEALYDIWKSFRPAIEKANYETIDMKLIEDLIQNRKEILSNL